MPLHTANLRGGWGRTKRWDYWCVLAHDLVVSVTYADVDYLGMVTVWAKRSARRLLTPDDVQPDHTVSNFDELRTVLRERYNVTGYGGQAPIVLPELDLIIVFKTIGDCLLQ